jgi:ferredoxin
LGPDDEGFVTLRGSSMDVPPHLEASAVAARNSCPEDAISLDG